MRPSTVLFACETDGGFETEPSPPMSLSVSMAADLATCSPIVCGFIFLATRIATTYSASVACLEIESAGFAAESNRLRFSATSRCSKNYVSFSRVPVASYSEVFSICTSSGIRSTTLYSTAHISPSQHHDH